MRKFLLPSFATAVLLATCVAQAEPINFNNIPSSSLGYIHADLDRSVAVVTKMATKAIGQEADAATMAMIRSSMPNSLTVVMLGSDKPVIMSHAGAEVRTMLVQLVDAANATTISHDGKDIKFVTISEQNAYITAILGPMIVASKAKGNKVLPITDMPQAGKAKNIDVYLANLDDKGLLVAATDLRSLITELDVLSGKADSLAKSDPRKLKLESKPDTAILGCFDVAALDNNEAGEEVAEKTENDALTKLLEGALNGSEDIKVQQVQVIVSEDGKAITADVNLTTADAAAAEQLKRLSLGVKALLSITNPDAKEYIDPLTVTAKDKATLLHWSFAESTLTKWFDDTAAALKASKESK